MAAHLNEPPQAQASDELRRAIRDRGDWSEDRAVTGLLHALELTGGARHRAVATAMALVEGARARRDERPFLAAHGGNEIAASAEQVEAVRRFAADLKAALAG